MNKTFIAPAKELSAFNCPQCGVFAKQTWWYMRGSDRPDGFGLQYENKRFRISECESCNAPTIWLGSEMIYPLATMAEVPNEDLPEEIKHDYQEANEIASRSPRAAAALLRLSIQKLCVHLGLPGQNLNNDIGSLVAKGLPSGVQQALDAVRVVGNEAVHPGEMDLRDDHDTARRLFGLVNFIAAKMISEPAEVENLYRGLPTSKLEAIKKRDGG